MEPFVKHTGLVAPLMQANVDTDQIIPKQFLKSIKRTGFGENLFNDWRYNADGSVNPDFVLNQPRYAGASVLVTGANFGSGSSREHAAWAIMQYGFKVLISVSFADIFRSNCYQNGLLPMEVPGDLLDRISDKAATVANYKITTDLEQQILSDGDEIHHKFQIDPFRKRCLLEGLDDIALTMQREQDIASYEQKYIIH